MKKYTTLFAIACFGSLQAQTVSTITEGSFTDGLGIDSQGNVYCSDYGGTEVFKYDTSGTVTLFASNLTRPNGIGVNSQDEVYVCEALGGTIHKYQTDGTPIEEYSGLNNPTGIKYDAIQEDLIWVSYNESSIYRLNPDDGSSTQIFVGAPLNGPSGIAFVGTETFISNFNDRKIFRLEDDNTLTEIAQLPSIGPPSQDFCGFLTSKGNQLFATHIGGHRIFKIDPVSGAVSIYAGSSSGTDDGDLATATFFQPNGILGDNANDRLFISDAQPKNLRIIDEVSLSVDAFAKAEFNLQLYPNPVKDSLVVTARLPVDKTYEIQIVDAAGKIMLNKTETVSSAELKLVQSVESWSSGVYFITLTLGDVVVTKQFLK